MATSTLAHPIASGCLDCSRDLLKVSVREIPLADAFLHDLPLLFRGSIYAWFPAHAASCLEALILPNLRCPVSAGSTTLISPLSRFFRRKTEEPDPTTDI